MTGQCKDELIVNTGSSVSIIIENTCHTLFPKYVLTELAFALGTYAKEKISVKGCLKVMMVILPQAF